MSREDAAAAMEDYAPDDAMLLALLDKKLQGDLSDPRAVQRAIAYLQRRGFPWSDIRRALTNMAQPWMSSSTDKKRRIKEDVP